MGAIRKQTIISSLLVYTGFLVGAVNMYLYTKTGSFTPGQYGLTRIFFDFAQNMSVLGALGVIPVIFKFYPYYKDNLEEQKIDLMSWALVASFAGFLLVLFLGWYFQSWFVGFYATKSKLVVDYYFWMIPFAVGLLFFSVLEGFCWALHKSVVSIFLKETFLRIVTCVLILLFYAGVIDFNIFIHLFSLQFGLVFIVLLVYLLRIGKLHFPLTVSRVTKKYWKKMLGMQALTFGGTFILSIAATIDVFIIAGVQNLRAVGIYVFAQYVANLLQVPQRSIQAVSTGVLSKAWKDKDRREIARIYQRSCINLLLVALFMFGNIWLNVSPGIDVLHIQPEYKEGLGVLFVLGMVRIVDAGTGLNALVINTSTFWKFDFYSSIVLFFFRIPITYLLIKNYGIIGSAFAELAAYSIFNFIRFEFLRRKFRMQPFTGKTMISLLLGIVAFAICYYSFKDIAGWTGIILRGTSFSVIMIAGIFYGKLTPDAHQLFEVVKSRFTSTP